MGTLCRNGVAISGAFGCPKKIGFIRALHSSFGSNNTSGGKVKYPFPVIPRNSHGHPEFMDMAARSGGAEPMLTLEQDNLKEATQKPKEEQKPPQWYYTSGVIKHFASMLAIRKYLSKELIKNIERSADQLYYHCANHYDFASLHKEFGLPDNFFAWYRLTLLHVWMMLTRLQQSMEIYAYCVYRRHLITALHTDMAERYRLIFSKNKYATLKRHSKYKELYNGVFMSSMFEYDEGFLCDDKVFAGAVWRSLFVQDPNLDIIHLNKAVRYIRETMHFLDGLDANQLLNDGLDRWAPADKISEEQKQRTQQL